MSDFIEDIERQYETYCEIAEEYGFLDVGAKKSGFRCTTKSSEFNAGWIAFTGAVSVMRGDQQAKIDELQDKVKEALFKMHQLPLNLCEDMDGYKDPVQLCQSEGVEMCVKILEKALRGSNS